MEEDSECVQPDVQHVVALSEQSTTILDYFVTADGNRLQPKSEEKEEQIMAVGDWVVETASSSIYKIVGHQTKFDETMFEWMDEIILKENGDARTPIIMDFIDFGLTGFKIHKHSRFKHYGFSVGCIVLSLADHSKKYVSHIELDYKDALIMTLNGSDDQWEVNVNTPHFIPLEEKNSWLAQRLYCINETNLCVSNLEHCGMLSDK